MENGGQIKDREKKLVLDMDSTLLSSIVLTEEEWKEVMKNYGEKLRKNKYFYEFKMSDGTYIIGMFRPGLWKFLEFAFENFSEVIIWSAGEDEYVMLACKEMFKGKRYRPHQIYPRSSCAKAYDEKKEREVFWKPLLHIYSNHPGANASNTLIIDDNEEYTKEDILNWLYIRPFDISIGNFKKKDNELRKMKKKLIPYLSASNVQAV